MSGHMNIRPICDEDVEQVVALWKLCELTRPWNDPYRDIDFARGKVNSDILVGFAGDKLIASAMVGYDGHRGYAYYVSVHPDWQGKGLGETLMDRVESWLAGHGVWKINLMIRDDNEKVLGFYEELGYERGKTVQLGKSIER
ncbi:MAG: GNAT family acetyltransferase [Methyloligellaceae bacterium]